MKIATVKFYKLEVDYKSLGIIDSDYSNKGYDYIIPDGMNVNIGDYCLVGIRNTQRCEIVKIVDIQDESLYSNVSKDKLMPLASKIDFECLNKYMEKVVRKEQLEKQIDNMYKKISKLKILEQMAKEDESLAKLVDEYKNLG